MVRIFRVDVLTGFSDDLRLRRRVCINGWRIGYFSVEINDFELELFKHTKGDAEGQQTGNALAMLAGPRLFFSES